MGFVLDCSYSGILWTLAHLNLNGYDNGNAMFLSYGRWNVNNHCIFVLLYHIHITQTFTIKHQHFLEYNINQNRTRADTKQSSRGVLVNIKISSQSINLVTVFNKIKSLAEAFTNINKLCNDQALLMFDKSSLVLQAL